MRSVPIALQFKARMVLKCSNTGDRGLERSVDYERLSAEIYIYIYTYIYIYIYIYYAVIFDTLLWSDAPINKS
jgi:hypothetical protein